MMNRLLLKHLWPEIFRISQKAHRTYAAIAYFSNNANLKLRKGDILIVNASSYAIKMGVTSAHLLHKLHMQGVTIYNREPLHAKVLVIDQQAVIGSANASQSSIGMDEAAIITDDPIVVSQMRSFIHQLARRSERLNKQRIDKLCKIKVTRKGGRGGFDKKSRGIQAIGNRMWITNVEECDENEYADEKSDTERAEKCIAKAHPESNPEWIRTVGRNKFRNNTQPGDLLIVVTMRKKEKIPHAVDPPSTVLWRQDKKGWTRFYYDSNFAYPRHKMTWDKFGKLWKSAGIKGRLIKSIERELTPVEAFEFTRLWPQSHNKRK